MLKKKLGKPFVIVEIVFKIIWSLFILYAILFSLIVTFAFGVAYVFINKPITNVKSLKRSNPVETAFMKEYRQKLRSDGQNDSLHRKFISLDSISSFLVNSVLAAEDDGFYAHPGIDIEAILNALEHNRSHDGVQHGASTITQQLAENLFLNSDRTYKRKFIELFYTLLMERYLGKERILELYLNYAQWGKNIFGCEAAAQFYYKKSSRTLNRSEAARLAAVLSMPSKLTPYHKTNYMGKRIGVIAQNLYLHKSINDSDYYRLTGYFPVSKEIPEPQKDTLSTTPSE